MEKLKNCWTKKSEIWNRRFWSFQNLQQPPRLVFQRLSAVVKSASLGSCGKRKRQHQVTHLQRVLTCHPYRFGKDTLLSLLTSLRIQWSLEKGSRSPMKGIDLSVYLWASNLCHVFWSDWSTRCRIWSLSPSSPCLHKKTPHWIVPHYPNSTAIWPTLHPTRHHFHGAPNGLLLQISPGFHQQPSAELLFKRWRLKTVNLPNFQPKNPIIFYSKNSASFWNDATKTIFSGISQEVMGLHIHIYATQYSRPDDLCFPCTYSQVQSTETLLILKTFVLGCFRREWNGETDGKIRTRFKTKITNLLKGN